MNKKKFIEAYKGKNVYITGITGFKGSWLALMLHYLGASVFGIGLAPEQDNEIFYQARIDEIANVTIGDITDNANVSKLIPSLINSCPDYIIHMATQPIVSESYKDPFNTFHTNILGTVMLHEIIRGLRIPANCDDLKNGHSVILNGEKISCKRISVVNITANTSCDKTSDKNSKSTDTNREVVGFDPYSLSRTCSDEISVCYREALNSPHYISTVRTGDIVGGGNMANNQVITDVIQSVITKRALEVHNPYKIHLHQHIFDVLSAYLTVGLLQKRNPEYQGRYDVGADANLAIETHDLINKMQEHLDFNWESVNQPTNNLSKPLVLDNSKIKLAGWKPVFSTNDAIIKSFSEWYNSFIQQKDMQKFTLNQIDEAFNNY